MRRREVSQQTGKGPDYGRGQSQRERINTQRDSHNDLDDGRSRNADARGLSTPSAQRSYYPPEMFESDPVRRPPYGSGPGRSNYGASKYGGSEYAEVDYDRTAAERSSDGGPYSLQPGDADGERYRQATDSWIPDDENDNRVNYDPGSWVNSPKAPRNRRQVEGSRDERIRRLVCERLSDAAALDDREIYVEVRNGEVTLTGVVRTRAEKYLAEEVVESVGGLVGINDRLQVIEGDPSRSSR